MRLGHYVTGIYRDYKQNSRKCRSFDSNCLRNRAWYLALVTSKRNGSIFWIYYGVNNDPDSLHHSIVGKELLIGNPNPFRPSTYPPTVSKKYRWESRVLQP